MELHLFDKQVYVGRRHTLKQNTGQDGIILLLGNDDSSMNYKDNCYPFRQDSSFLYYFGLDVAGLAGIIDTDTGEEVIFGNELTIDDIVWTGTLPTVSEMASMVGVIQTKPYDQIIHYVHKALIAGRKVHILPPYRPENKIKLAAWFNTSLDDIAGYVSVNSLRLLSPSVLLKPRWKLSKWRKPYPSA